MRTLFHVAAFGAACVAAPLAAQEPTGAETEEVSQAQVKEVAAMMANPFVAEPLTAEQEVRLPAAQAVVGTMMGKMVDKMIRPMMSMFSSPEFFLAARLDLDEEAIGNLTTEEQAEISAMLDPASTGGSMQSSM